MYPVFSYVLYYGKTTDQLQQTAISKILLLRWFFYLRRPELQFREEGQLGHVLLSLILHVKPHCELRGWEWTEQSSC